MAIHPIDLQTLYSQMEKVGRQQGAEQQLSSTVRDVQQDQNKIDAQRKLSTVQVIEQNDDDNLKINKDSHSDGETGGFGNGQKKSPGSEGAAEEEQTNFIKDPYLGQKIDISG